MLELATLEHPKELLGILLDLRENHLVYGVDLVEDLRDGIGEDVWLYPEVV